MSGIKSLLACAIAWAAAAPAFAANVVYNNMAFDPINGYGEAASDNPVFGGDLTLAQPGTLNTLGLTLYNPFYSDATGAILTGYMYVTFYDNTTAYGGGTIANPILGAAVIPFDYSNAGGLPAGYYDQQYFDLSSLNIHLSQNIFITQQFSMTSGGSLYNGAMYFNGPSTGGASGNGYIKSDQTPEGLYVFANGAPLYFGYYVTVTPDAPPPPANAVPLPAAVTGFAVLTGALGLFRVRRKFARA